VMADIDTRQDYERIQRADDDTGSLG
jgi:hypothetical protein